MNRSQKQSRNAAPCRWVRAGLLLGLFLFVLAMVQFESLHRLVHADAGQSQHQCAVTWLASGQVDLAGSEVLVAFLPAVIVAQVMPPVSISVAVDYFLLPDRAPPVALA